MKTIFRVAFALAVLITAMSVFGSVASSHWIGELFAQPRPQYVIGLVLCVFPIVRRYPRAGWCVLVPVVLDVTCVAPLYLHSPPKIMLGDAQFSIVHANVDRFNADPEKEFAWLRDQNATIISLQEVTPEFEKEFARATSDYAVVLSHALTNSHGSTILVKRNAALTNVSARIIHLPSTSERPLIEFLFNIREHEFAFLSLFVSRPIWRQHFAYQSLELQEAARWANEQQRAGREVIIAGDLNITPWSPRFKKLCQDANLVNSQTGLVLQSTWPAALPRVVGLPIDHCLHSSGISTVSRSIGSGIGSDHRPLLLHLRVARRF